MLARLSFRTKISLAMMAVLLGFGVSVAVVISRTATQALLEESKRRGISGTLHVTARIEDPLLAMDFLRMKDVADEVTRTSEDIAYLFILNEVGTPLVHTFQGGFPTDLLLVNSVSSNDSYRIQLLTTGKELIHDFAVPVMIGNNRLGTVRLGVSHERIGAAVDRLLSTILVIIGLAIVLAASLGTLVSRTTTRRIEVLRQSAEEIVKGNLDVHTSPVPVRQCWQFAQCERTECPAYHRADQRCWHMAGTLCPTCAEGEYDKKIDNCRGCLVYRSNAGDEIQHLADYFDLMAATLKRRLEDLVKTQNDLQKQQHLFQTIINVTPDLLSLHDPELRCLAFNKAFSSFFGLREEETLGTSCVLRLDARDADADRMESLQVMSSGVPVQTERRMHGVAGDAWFHVVKTPVLDPEGRVIGLLCNARDITTFRELQERISQSQKLESLGQLAAGVAHEINTPLGIILGYTQLLLDDLSPDSEPYETLKTVEKHTRICKKIVADLLRFSRNTQTDKKPLNLNDIIGQVVSVVEHTFGLEHIAVQQSLDPELPEIFGDSEKLLQVFMNLLNNAYDAIDSDGTVMLATQYDAARKEVIVKVADTGCGIAPEIRPRIFDPFFTTKSVENGTGLGLAVTFGIVRDHGGQIDVESGTEADIVSKLGRDAGSSGCKGTVFTLRFPAFDPSIPLSREIPELPVSLVDTGSGSSGG